MRIAITAQGATLDAEVDSRFGRAANFLVVDTDNMNLLVVENTQSLNLPQGAGIQAAQNILPHKPEAVLTGNCGPKAFRILQASGIKVVTGVNGKVSDAVKGFLEGNYMTADSANVEGHWG